MDHFHHLVEYQLAVCKECQYAVWPEQIAGHLHGKHHKIPRNQANAIAEEVCNWFGLIPFASELEVPAMIDRPIPQLPLYEDGLMCQLEPEKCSYICRDKKALKHHWYKKHQYSVASGRGGSGAKKKQIVESRFESAVKHVYCQRFFPKYHGSQYFEVCVPREAQDDQARAVVGDELWGQLRTQALKRLAEVEKKSQETIQEVQTKDANPWLERTGWSKYLKNLNRMELLESIQEPNGTPDAKEEPVEAAIWKVMGEIAEISQESITTRVGVFVRMEMIRTEQHQTKYHPLQPYQHGEKVKDRVHSWRQVLMFFARTQKEHDWRSPKYRFTDAQQQAWDRLIEEARQGLDEEEESSDDEEEEEDQEEEEDMEEDEDMEEEETNQAKPKPLTSIQKACLDFCVELLNQTISQREYDSALVCALAVLGIKEDGWKGPDQYPPILSSIIKIARFMLVQKALEIMSPDGKDAFNNDRPYDFGFEETSHPVPAPVGKEHKGCLQLVARMMDTFMVRGSHSPMQWMLDLRTYGMRIHFNTTATGHIGWHGHDEILYKNVQFNMSQFRSFVHGLVEQCRQIMEEELLFCGKTTGEKMPKVPWKSIRDNPTNEQPGWNFLRDQRTKMPVDGQTWLFDRIGRDNTIRRRFSRVGSQSGVNQEGVRAYMEQVVKFQEKLLVLMHITGGQPARAPEILSIRHSNTGEGAHRNIFVEDGMVVFVTRYHKGYQMQGDVKIIHRYLPREVGELYIRYLWLVLPFQQQMEVLVREKEMIETYMWTKSWNGKEWTSERMRQVLKKATMAGLGQELTIQAYRDVAIGISRRFMRGSTMFQQEEQDGEEMGENPMVEIADLQAGHTSHVAGMIYARGMMEGSGVVAEKRQHFRMSSEDWHRFLGFESAMVDGDGVDRASGKRKRCPFEEEADEERFERWRRLKRVDMAEQLRGMMGDGANFRSVQQQAMEAIQAGVSPVVTVMPTGEGKSILFMLPAWVEPGGTTVVVVPLIALRGDMKRRCDRLGIVCAEWKRTQQPDGAAIVLVTPESAVGKEFGTYLNRMRTMRRLDRIVIDECHIILNDGLDFRKYMQQLGQLMTAETQMVLLTATLPPTKEVELRQKMGWTEGQMKIFRAPTVRKNIQYQVLDAGRYSKQREKEIIEELVMSVLSKSDEGKVVIYCNTIQKVEDLVLAGLFCCEGFHSKVKDGLKVEILEDFRTGLVRVVVATSALGMGVDIPDIRLIVHADEPRNMLDYAQESGRAGRDGLVSRVVVVRWERGVENGERDELVRRFMDGDRECRRVVMSEYMDGAFGRVECEDGEERCDVCMERWRALGMVEEVVDEQMMDEQVVDEQVIDEQVVDERQVQQERVEFRRHDQERRSGGRRILEQRQNVWMGREQIERELARWKGVCVVCMAEGRENMHSISQCKEEKGKMAENERQIAQRRIRFDAYSACFKCGVPQDICERFEDNGCGGFRMKDGVSCQYFGVVFGMLYGVKHGYFGIWEDWMSRLKGMGVDVEDDGKLLKYLGSRREDWGYQSSRLIWEFLWVMERLSNRME
jgi:superfamily II DNA helicase RecQ